MSTRYRLGKDGHTLWDGERQIAVITGELSDGAKIVRALNERDQPLREFVEVTGIDRAGIELMDGSPLLCKVALVRSGLWPSSTVPPDNACACVTRESCAQLQQHSGHYGVPAEGKCDGHCSGNWTDPDCSWHGRPKPQHKGHYGAPVTVDCPVPRCTATSQDLPAHMADYHPELHHSADYVASEACPNLIFPEHGAESPCVRCGFKK